MADESRTKANTNTAAEAENWKLGLFTDRRRVFFGLLAVVFVVSFEVVKATQHARLAHVGETIDRQLTYFWVLDGLAAAVVTFALVWVALSFERMDGLLEEHRKKSERLFGELTNAQREVASVRDTLVRLTTDTQALSRGLTAGVQFLETLNSTEMLQVLDSEPRLKSGLMSSLSQLTSAWASLIKNESGNDYTTIDGTRYGLVCWRVAIETYMAEEALDIGRRTIATNLGVYVGLIVSIVTEILSLTKGSKAEVELFASTNLLPAEFFNWKEYRNSSSQYQSLFGTSLSFMDGYRQTIKKWLKLESGPTLTRLIVVQNLSDEVKKKERAILDALGLQRFSSLREQNDYCILCDANSGEPYLDFVESLRAFQDLDAALVEQYARYQAYGIGRSFAFAPDRLAAAHLSIRPLMDVFAEQLHSGPAANHALYFAIRNEECVKHLDYLPTIPLEGQAVKCADFLAIRIKSGAVSKVVACIAAQLKPNLETMALHLITTPGELNNIGIFMDYATDKATSISKLGKD